MITFSAKAYDRFLDEFLAEASPVAPRGIPTKEILNANLVLTNPRDRLVSNSVRRLNLGFAVAEFVGILLGYSSVSFFTRFIHDYDRFSTDGVTIDGAYGSRLHRPARVISPEGEEPRRFAALNAVREVIQRLKDDPDTRQAVITIRLPEDLQGFGGKSEPCTLSLQYFLRSGSLHAITTMRSNDIWTGLPYDVFQFTMLQEYVTRHVGARLGSYYHNAGSLHLYDSDFLKSEAVHSGLSYPHLMREMPFLTAGDLKRLGSYAIDRLMDEESFFTLTRSTRGWSSPAAYEYCLNLIAVMRSFAFRRVDSLAAEDSVRYVSDPLFKAVTSLWFTQKA